MAGFLVLLVAVSCLGAYLLLGLAIRYRARLRTAAIEESGTEYSPRATVIVPCKGIDLDFERNVLALLEQDYADYSVIFVTQDQDDPAYAHLARLVSRFPDRARLTTAGLASGRCQKVHNQLAALQLADRSAEIFVFVDSDGYLNRRFLKRLIAPMSNPSVGITTGYRWFVPVHRRIAEIVAVLWAAVEDAVLADPQFTHPWGGAMAIRREVFEQLDMTRVWSGASTDDTALGWAARRAGVHIVFEPRAAVPSAVDYSLSQFMAFGTRQLLLLRVYFPEMWWQLLALTAIAALAPAVGLVLIITGLMIDPTMLVIGLALMAAGLASVFSTATIARSTEHLLTALGQPVTPLALWDFLAAPLGAILLLAQFARSGWTRRVEWRGVTYEFLAPDRTVVHNSTNGERINE